MAQHMRTIRKGGSLPFVFDRGGEDISGWICTIEVKQYPGDTPAITREVAPDGREWPGFLTSTETAALAPLGTWMIVGVITNAAEDREETPPIRFSLAETL